MQQQSQRRNLGQGRLLLGTTLVVLLAAAALLFEARLQGQLSLPVLLASGAGALALVALLRLSTARPETPGLPAVVGGYRLRRMLGSGGVGEVWEAEHPQDGRVVALKRLRNPQKDGPAARRFLLEARVTAQLRSAHAVRLYELGVDEQGHPWFTMERLEGEGLDQLVAREGALAPRRVVSILSQIATALDEAHGLGYVHRDVKPSNVFVSREADGSERLRLLDWGVARTSAPRPAVSPAPESAPSGDPLLTDPGHTTGTPAFMAPEMALEPHTADPRSDIYALGCVAYYLLTASLPFRGPGPLQMMVDHVRTAPQRPSERLGRPLPAELEQLVLECMAKDPQARPQDAGELLERLRQLSRPARVAA